MICKNCGFNNNDGDVFCSICGTALTDNQPIREPVQESVAEPVAQPVQEPVAQPVQPQYQQPYGHRSYQQPYQQPYQHSYQQPYQQPFYPQYAQNQENVSETVKMKEWLLSFLILCIPVAGIVMTFVWAFSSNTKKSKSNFFKAYLIWILIAYALVIVLVIALVAIFTAVGVDSSDMLSEIPLCF